MTLKRITTARQLKAAVKAALNSHVSMKCACGHTYGRHLKVVKNEEGGSYREYIPHGYTKTPLKCDRCRCKTFEEDNLEWLVANEKKPRKSGK